MSRKGPHSVLIIEARFYEDIADELARGAIEELEANHIDYERLAAFPAAARCVVCQRQRETVYAHEATPRL